MQTMSAPFTRALYTRLPEGFPAQLVDGVLVRDPLPTGGHQALVGALLLATAPLVGLRRAFVAPIDVALDELNVLQPDLAIFDEPPPLDEHDLGLPAVVFEVLSPPNRRLDRTVKIRKYLAAGVREVWLVDPERETLEIHTLEDRRIHRRDRKARSTVVKDLVLVPAELFSVLR